MTPRAALRSFRPALLFLALQWFPVPASAQSARESTTVVILGVDHSAQLVSEPQRPAMFRALFDRVAPDAIAVERDPRAFARGDFYDFTYEVQELAVPWAREQRLPVYPIDWVPPTEDQRLLFGLDLEAAPFVRPTRGFGGFLSFSDSTLLSQSVLFADAEGAGDRALEFADTPAEDANRESARRLFLYRTYLQARRIIAAAANHRGGTLLVVIGYMHKPDLERILVGYPAIELVQPSHYGMPSRDEVALRQRIEDAYAVATFNLLGVQPRTGVVDYPYVRRVVDRLQQHAGLTPEVRLFRTRLGVLTGEIQPKKAAEAYRQIRQAAAPGESFTWTGVTDGSRLDSFFDPFGNLTVPERAALEQARQLYELGRAEEADALHDELAEALSLEKATQLRAYWREHLRIAP